MQMIYYVKILKPQGINGGDNVDANALECFANDEAQNVQTTGAIDEEELNDVVHAILLDICESKVVIVLQMNHMIYQL